MIGDHVYRRFSERGGVKASECAYMTCRRPAEEHEPEIVRDWDRYQQCPVCFAELGKPCLAQSGQDESGLIAIPAPRPHGGRKLRAGYGRG